MITKILFILLFSLNAYTKCIDLAKLKLRDLDGSYKSLNELIDKEKINLISIFQTTCIPCIQEIKFFSMPEFKEKYNVIYINTKESRTDLYKFLNKFEFNLEKVLVDSYGKFDSFYNVKNLPMLFYLNLNGQIIQAVSGKETAQILDLERFNIYTSKIKNKKCI